MQFIGIIPARYASSRFPGKPLADIGGKTMIQRVWEQACKALPVVLVATDDERIYQHVLSFGGQAIMTSPNHRCGTDRIYEAFTIFCRQNPQWDTPDTVIVNIQGDEPFIRPTQIEALKSCFPTDIATLVRPYTSQDSWEDLVNPNTPKVAVSPSGYALYFSRSVIPYVRGVEQKDWLQSGRFYRHIGMYAYRADILAAITAMAPTPLEQSESLEQLRWLENGLRIRVAETSVQSIGIDTPADLQQAVILLKQIENEL